MTDNEFKELRDLVIPTKRKHWTKEEDEAIRSLLERNKDTKWTEISRKLSTEFGIANRSGKQCRERWFNHLSPEINKTPWSAEEQITLFNCHKELGNIWAHISTFLPGRSENAVKNQFYSLLRRQYRKYKGCEPTRKELKKYDSTLSSQILAALGKKVGVHIGIKKTFPKKKKAVEEEKTIDDMTPIELHSEHSTVLDEHDFFVPII